MEFATHDWLGTLTPPDAAKSPTGEEIITGSFREMRWSNLISIRVVQAALYVSKDEQSRRVGSSPNTQRTDGIDTNWFALAAINER
jgi:hypothetical protein